MPENRQLGRYLRALRHERGLTAHEIAERLGFSDENWRNYETGRNRVGLPDVPRFAAALGVSTEELLARLRLVEQPAAAAPTSPAAHRFYDFLRRYPQLRPSLEMLQVAELSERDIDGLIWFLEGVVSRSLERRPEREGVRDD